MPIDQHRDTMTARVLEATLGWAKNTFFAGTIGGSLYFVFTQLIFGTNIYTSACFGGFIASVLWFGSSYRTRNLMSYWNDRLGVIEAAEPETTPVFGGAEFEAMDQARVTSSKIFFAIIALVGVGWLDLTICSFLCSVFRVCFL